MLAEEEKLKTIDVNTSVFDAASEIMNIPGNIYFKDKNGSYLWCNKAQLDVFGLSTLDQIVGKTDFDLCDHDTALRIREEDLKIMTTGRSEVVEEHGRVGANKISTLSHKAPLKNSKGEIIGIIGNSIDNSKQKTTYKQLLAENHTNATALDNILANLPAHIHWKDKNSVILGCNDRQAEGFGLSIGKEFIGKTAFDFVDEESAKKIHESDAQIIASGKVEIIEEPVIIKGKHYTFITHKAPFKDLKTGAIIGVIGVSIDITKQKKLEQCYAEQARELARALEVKEEFLKNISHEIRTPLQGIMGLTDALDCAWDQAPEDVKKKSVKALLESRDRLMNLLSNFLDLSMLKKGRVHFDFRYYDIKLLIVDVMTEFQYITHPIDLCMESNVDSYICCDEWRIKQVLRNVIANAVKHGGKDKPIKISVTAISKDKETKYLQIAIQDEGVGIDEAELDVIFDPFHEGKKTKRPSGGTGIGLAICKDIIGAHRGEIWAENNAKVGSTFYVTLPYERQPTKTYTFRMTVPS